MLVFIGNTPKHREKFHRKRMSVTWIKMTMVEKRDASKVFLLDVIRMRAQSFGLLTAMRKNESLLYKCKKYKTGMTNKFNCLETQIL